MSNMERLAELLGTQNIDLEQLALAFINTAIAYNQMEVAYAYEHGSSQQEMSEAEAVKTAYEEFGKP